MSLEIIMKTTSDTLYPSRVRESSKTDEFGQSVNALTECNSENMLVYRVKLRSCAIDNIIVLPTISWGKAALQKMAGFENLKRNWDTYDALPIEPENICLALKLLEGIISSKTPEPDIFPVPDGGIQFEWGNEKYDLEVEVSEPQGVMVLFEDEEGHTNTWGKPVSEAVPEIRKLIKRCFENINE